MSDRIVVFGIVLFCGLPELALVFVQFGWKKQDLISKKELGRQTKKGKTVMVTAESYTVKREKYWGEVRYVTKYLMGSRIVFVMVFIKKNEGWLHASCLAATCLFCSCK